MGFGFMATVPAGVSVWHWLCITVQDQGLRVRVSLKRFSIRHFRVMTCSAEGLKAAVK